MRSRPVLSRPVQVAGRCLLWATVVLVFGRGLVSLFAGTGAGGAADPVPVRELSFPVAAAQAFAARFAADYLTYDSIDPSDWAARTSAYGTDSLRNAWDGKGTQSVTSVVPGATEVQSSQHAVVTIAVLTGGGLTGGGWVHLAVPVALTRGALSVAGPPAFVAAPAVGKTPEADLGEVDTATTEAVRSTVEAFLSAYAAGQRAVTRAMSAEGARFPELEPGRFALAGIDDLVVPQTKKGEARSALAAVRWADARSGATLTQSYRLGLTRDGHRWLVNDLGAARPEPNQAKPDQETKEQP